MTAAPTNATYTTQAASRSASRCTGAGEACAARTVSMICPYEDSAPTRTARTSIAPVWLIDPAYTLSPTVTSTGMDSPVIRD